MTLKKELPLMTLIRFVTTFLAVLTLYLLWKYMYFESIIPNTFYAKVSRSAVEGIKSGMTYLLGWLMLGMWIPLLFSFVALTKILHNRSVAFMATFSAVIICYVVLVGGDLMKYYRFLVPVVPPVVILGMMGLERVRFHLRKKNGSAVINLFHIAVIVGAGFFLFLNGIGHMKLIRNSFSMMANKPHNDVRIAQFLTDKFPPDTLLATFNIGRIPFYTNFETIDLLGLTDPDIAREIRLQRVCAYLDVLYKKHPDIIIPQTMEIHMYPERKWWQRFDFDVIGTRQLLDFTKFIRLDREDADSSICPTVESAFGHKYRKEIFSVHNKRLTVYVRQNTVDEPTDHKGSETF